MASRSPAIIISEDGLAWIVHGLCMHTRHSMHAHVMDCACILSLLLGTPKKIEEYHAEGKNASS